ncbi:hypothetical protein [Desertivirga brevis]|uniref:hypothetical protein n=1 Tax=Desertivirga brevis TaxID=2810310 RepID=UPI001A960E03|nr:hypothetical protein [Pedobacter sp. SYSU D00873]
MNRLKTLAGSTAQKQYPKETRSGQAIEESEMSMINAGAAVLPLTLVTLIEKENKRKWGEDNGGCSTSDSSDSSDGGSSCSSSCGGCGGGGD